MNEPLDRLEAELAQMQPRPLSTDVIQQIEARLSAGEARPWADRFLLSAMCSGALAACVIITVFVTQPRSVYSNGKPVAVNGAPRLGDSPLLFARADSNRPDMQ